jgi:hypothetical protein
MSTNIHKLVMYAAVVLSLGSAHATQFTTDETDLWWNPAESGWGMQVVHEADTIFVTLYVYDQANNPIWYVATGVYQGNLVWTGDLYQTTGPWFGSPVFNPAAVTATNVGTLTFYPFAVSSATLVYSVNGVVVTKQIQRQTLRYDSYKGAYVGQFKNELTCDDPSQNGTFIVPVALTVAHTGTSAFTMISTGSAATCTYTGTYSQNGRFGSVSNGSYSCTDGTSGTFHFFEMYVNIAGFTGAAHSRTLRARPPSISAGCASRCVLFVAAGRGPDFAARSPAERCTSSRDGW